MSLFGSLMAGFDDDPFFGGHRSMMRQMDQMMNSVMGGGDPFRNDPFFGGGGGGIGGMSGLGLLGMGGAGGLMGMPMGIGGGSGGLQQAITAGPQPPQQHHHHRGTTATTASRSSSTSNAQPQARRPRTTPPTPNTTATPSPPNANNTNNALATPFGMPNIAGMVNSLDQLAQSGNCHMYSSSSVMTMTTGPDGRPQVYQATSSTTGVPGGVKETRRTVSDSRTGTRRMAIGHHIGDRSHIIERESSRDADVEERQEFINLEEDEAAQFDREFRQRTQHAMGSRQSSLQYSPHHRRPRHTTTSPPPHRTTSSYSSLPAITGPPSSRYRSRPRPMLSITAGSRDDRVRRRDREERANRAHRRYHQPTM